MWFHSAISVATDDCIDYINVEKKGRVEMDEDNEPGIGITVNSPTTITGTITGATFTAYPPKKFTLTIEVTAKSASEAVALVQDFANNIKIEEVPQNFFGTTIQNV